MDVLLDPVQGSDDVEQRVVAGRVAVAGAQETCKTCVYITCIKTPTECSCDK